MKTKLALLALLTVAAPELGRAYAAQHTAYDTKTCRYLSFDPSAPDAAGITTIVGYTQPVQGRGNATEFTGRMAMSDDAWSFFAEPSFLLAGSTFRRVARGIMECATGCSAHGVKYLFETSSESVHEDPLFLRYQVDLRKLCPAHFVTD